MTYSRGLEIAFTDLLYVCCPARFSDAVFRHPTRGERNLVHRFVGDRAPVVVAFDVDAALAAGRLACVIAAEAVDVLGGTVYRYWREDLQEGQRPAAFVRPPVQFSRSSVDSVAAPSLVGVEVFGWLELGVAVGGQPDVPWGFVDFAVVVAA